MSLTIRVFGIHEAEFVDEHARLSASAKRLGAPPDLRPLRTIAEWRDFLKPVNDVAQLTAPDGEIHSIDFSQWSEHDPDQTALSIAFMSTTRSRE